VRTALFVPGDRPERFAKAAAAQPDLVIIDLEDAVAPESKAAALEHALLALAPGRSTGLRAAIRINQGAGVHAELDALAALHSEPDHGLAAIVVPKSEDPGALAAIGARLPGLPVIALVESALGVLRAAELAMVGCVERLALGAVDLSADLGSHDNAVIDHARFALALASRAAGIAPPLDSPCLTINDGAVVEAAARLARSYGFDGQLCIHPDQVPVVRAAFAPHPDEVAWALTVVDAQPGASQVNGTMVDRPVIDRARRILADAGVHA
jgi:citrate lyase beta subunit